MECPECGAQVTEEDLFCGECGAVLEIPLPDERTEEPAPRDLPLEPLPPPPPPASPSYAPAVQDSRATAALILGAVSIGSVVMMCLPLSSLLGCVGPIAGIIAIVLGIKVTRDIKVSGGLEKDRKRAQIGLILGAVGTALYFVLLALGLLFTIGAGWIDYL